MLCDDSVIVASHAIKTIEELFQNFSSGFLAVDEVLVFRHVVNLVNIIDADGPVAAFVHHLEYLVDHVLSALGEWVSEAADELFVGDVAITIDIVVAHEGLDLDDFGEDVVGGERLGELSLVQLAVAVVVHAAEDDA